MTKDKLKAIWNFIWSEHYVLITPTIFQTCYPNDDNNNCDLIRRMAVAANEFKKKQTEKE